MLFLIHNVISKDKYLFLTHDVRQDYNKYYKTVITNLIGNLPYKKGDSRNLVNRILKSSVIPACEPASPWNLPVNILNLLLKVK